MRTLKNINESEADDVFETNDFGDDIMQIQNNDGTIDIYFPSDVECEKFIILYDEL